MPPDETECRNCGAFVIDEAVVRLCRALGIDRPKALALFEAGFRHPTQLKDRDVNGVLERRESGLLFLCTNCGSFVATDDPRCARCGSEFEPDEPAWSEADEDILDLVLCPNCGADNGPDWAECEICGVPLPGIEPRPRAPPTPAEASAGPEPPQATEADRDREPDELDGILADLQTALAPSEQVPAGPREETSRPAPRAAEPPKPIAIPTPTVRAPERLPRKADTLIRMAEPNRDPLAARPPSPPEEPHARAEPRDAPARPAARPERGLEPDRSVQATPPGPIVAIPRAMPAETRQGPVEPAARRLVKQPAEFRVRRSEPDPTVGRARALTPRELLGPAVAAAGLSLIAMRSVGPAWVAWAIAFVLAALAGYGIAGAWPTLLRLRRIDAALLLAGSAVGIATPMVGSAGLGIPDPALLVLAICPAPPLAFATRRLLARSGRILLAAAAAAPLTAAAVAVAEGVAYALSDAWLAGLLALLPWPAAVAAFEVRGRATSLAVRKELAEAERHYADEDYARSVEDYDRAIRLSERGSRREDLPWYGKGAALIILGRYEDALVSIDRALDINPRNEVAWLNKGNALTKMGRLLDALRSFNAAIKVNPAYEVAWNNKGNALARLGRYEEALRCYEKALELDPDYRGAWVNKGYVLAKLGRYDEAAACADRVIRLGEVARAGPA
jgi:tetratricopeptide (TPR) repeat protein/ribosomal protein L40E